MEELLYLALLVGTLGLVYLPMAIVGQAYQQAEGSGRRYSTDTPALPSRYLQGGHRTGLRGCHVLDKARRPCAQRVPAIGIPSGL